MLSFRALTTFPRCCSLPLWLHRLTSLTTLELDASDGLGVPPAVLRLSTADLMRFLRATEQKSIRWNTAKVGLLAILHEHFLPTTYPRACS